MRTLFVLLTALMLTSGIGGCCHHCRRCHDRGTVSMSGGDCGCGCGQEMIGHPTMIPGGMPMPQTMPTSASTSKEAPRTTEAPVLRVPS
jgi:hypothetical protein